MKSLIVLYTIVSTFNFHGTETNSATLSPLTGFSPLWNDAKYEAANTASGISYLSEKEKEVIYILNLLRMDPDLFNSTVVNKYPEYTGAPSLKNNSYYTSLVATLKRTSALSILAPNPQCYKSAFCHAKTSGLSGYTGHDRLTDDCKKSTFFYGECISYGYDSPIDIVMTLLIDQDIPSLGHRNIILGDYSSVSLSMQPHSKYRFNTVIDFAY